MSSINESSTTEEILVEIRYSFESQEFDKLQRILVQREEDLKTTLRKSKQDLNLLKEKYEVLDKKHCISEIKNLDLEQQLKKLKIELDSLKNKNSLSESENQLSEQKSIQETVIELTSENEKLKEEIGLYRQKFSEHVNRIACIEELLASLLEKDALNCRAENGDDNHSPNGSTSSRIQTEIQNSHMQTEGGDTMHMCHTENRPSTGLNVHNSASDLQRGINEPLSEGIVPGPAAVNVEVSVREEEMVSPSVNRAEPLIIVVDSDSSSSDDDVSITDSYMDGIVNE